MGYPRVPMAFLWPNGVNKANWRKIWAKKIFFSKKYPMSFLPHYCHSFRITVIPSGFLSFLPDFCHSFRIEGIGTMRVPEGDLHCQCKLSIFSLSSFGPCIVFWILQKGTCIGKCIFSIFPAVTHQLKCKQTCIEKCRPRHKISMKKWLKIHQISKNVNLFPYVTTNLHW